MKRALIGGGLAAAAMFAALAAPAIAMADGDDQNSVDGGSTIVSNSDIVMSGPLQSGPVGGSTTIVTTPGLDNTNLVIPRSAPALPTDMKPTTDMTAVIPTVPPQRPALVLPPPPVYSGNPAGIEFQKREYEELVRKLKEDYENRWNVQLPKTPPNAGFTLDLQNLPGKPWNQR